MQIILRRRFARAWLVFALACVAVLGWVTYKELTNRGNVPFDGTIWNNHSSSLGPGVEHHTYHSEIMNVEVGYNIHLPPQYAANPAQRFSVIYWLHGRGGDENSDVADVMSGMNIGSVPPAIIVFVNGGRNSKYMDAVGGSPMHGVLMVESTIGVRGAISFHLPGMMGTGCPLRRRTSKHRTYGGRSHQGNTNTETINPSPTSAQLGHADRAWPNALRSGSTSDDQWAARFLSSHIAAKSEVGVGGSVLSHSPLNEVAWKC
jgi:Putative esterase